MATTAELVVVEGRVCAVALVAGAPRRVELVLDVHKAWTIRPTRLLSDPLALLGGTVTGGVRFVTHALPDGIGVGRRVTGLAQRGDLGWVLVGVDVEPERVPEAHLRLPPRAVPRPARRVRTS